MCIVITTFSSKAEGVLYVLAAGEHNVARADHRLRGDPPAAVVGDVELETDVFREWAGRINEFDFQRLPGSQLFGYVAEFQMMLPRPSRRAKW